MQICEGRAFQAEGTASAKSQDEKIVVEFEEQQAVQCCLGFGGGVEVGE